MPHVGPTGSGGDRAIPSGSGGRGAPHGGCDILTQGLIGLIEYSYHQSISSFPEAHLQITLRLSVLGSEQFQDG
jgi:hypothetical protein